ncbi:protein-glutamate methylesterase/protein-glutamine glutaminase [Undibacterium squillarum]|uniref:protein-glutamate methylesterase/protein-glutamine glutaminase n=1 Tax=Undibacterium squillarum TaxID=1131567 RepID=UPI0035ADA144
MSKKIKVMLVDDSAVVRQVLAAVLARDPELEVIATAADPLFAMNKMNQNWPDVVVLDVEMPRMDGITFLKQVMAVRPTPVVICSTLTEKGAATSVQAMSAGAVAIVTKPKQGLRDFLASDAGDLVQTVKEAAAADMRRLRASIPPAPPVVPELQKPLTAADIREKASAMAVTTDKLVAIGTSTGGTQALELVLSALPADAPGIVIVQHMPEKFTAAFSERLNKICQIEVREAAHGDRVLDGLALVAPGGKHMQLRRNGAQYQVDIFDGPPVNRHKPSVDVLFRSVAKHAGANALGVIMTGMGDDGALGLLEMHQAGAETLAQDEKTCVVYGMPKEAVKHGAVDRIVPLQEIAGLISQYGKRHR